MRTTFFFITGLIAVITSNSISAQNNSSTKNNMENNQKDNTPKVTGVGGVFFFSENPKAAREWYAKNLGLETNDYGCTFESRELHNPNEINKLQ